MKLSSLKWLRSWFEWAELFRVCQIIEAAFFFKFFFCSLFFSLTLFVRWLNDCVFLWPVVLYCTTKIIKCTYIWTHNVKFQPKWCYSHSNESHIKKTNTYRYSADEQRFEVMFNDIQNCTQIDRYVFSRI